MMYRLACLVALGLVAAVPASARNLDFRLVNDSGYTLRELYLSPESSERWGNDVLGRQMIDTGGSATVNFPSAADECMYDMRMIFSDNDELTDTVDLCEVGTYTIN